MNIAHLLLNSALEFPDHTALARGMTATASYRDLWRKVAVMSTHLRVRFGLRRGDRVAFAMTNCVESIEVMYAIWHAGLCAVPMNAKLHAREFAFILENSGARLCFVTPDLATTIAEAARDAPELKEIVDTATRPYTFMAVGDPSPIAACQPTDPAWLFYTSGTTGRPKGATLTHRNLLAMTLNYYADVDRPVPGGSIVHAAPISHGSGLWNFPMLARGSVQVFPETGKYEVPETVELMNRWPDCSIFLAPTMVKRLIEHGSVGDLVPGALRLVTYGGAPMYVSDLKRALEILGDRVLIQLYGQGESPMTITHLSPAFHAAKDHPRWEQRLASAGLPDTCIEVLTVDEDGKPVPAGEVGEIVCRGDTVMSGYWNNPEATAKSLRDGWLWTGDVGAFDEEGFLTLKDRSKDMIISGGSNIYPREIEDVLNLHPAVAECSVVGRPHPEWGEDVVAFIVARSGARPTPAELDKLCLDNIARFKRPKDYKFIDALPKNNYGKILKTELRSKLQEETMGSMIDFKRPDGSTCKGYLAEAGKGKPGLVVIQEWWGLNDQIKGVADRFAAAGYNALAPDLYKGRVTQKPDEANHMMSGLDFVGASDQDIAGAVKHLAAIGGKVGCMGFCMGGALTIAAAARVPGIACGVPFYGVPPAALADPAKISIPMQGHFANQDDWCTPQVVDDFEKAMNDGGNKPEIHRYEAAHAFANEKSPAYDAAAAKRAWERMMAFLGKNL